MNDEPTRAQAQIVRELAADAGEKPSDRCCLNFGCPNPEVCNNELKRACSDPV